MRFPLTGSLFGEYGCVSITFVVPTSLGGANLGGPVAPKFRAVVGFAVRLFNHVRVVELLNLINFVVHSEPGQRR